MSEETSEVEPVPVPCAATSSSDGDEHELEDEVEGVVPAGQLQVEKDKEEALLANMNTAAADTLQDMDSAIRGLRDWQKQRDLEVAQLEKEHQKLLDKVRARVSFTSSSIFVSWISYRPYVGSKEREFLLKQADIQLIFFSFFLFCFEVYASRGRHRHGFRGARFFSFSGFQ